MTHLLICEKALWQLLREQGSCQDRHLRMPGSSLLVRSAGSPNRQGDQHPVPVIMLRSSYMCAGSTTP